MHGNVYERCSDWHEKEYYARSPEITPTGHVSDLERVLRGGRRVFPAERWCTSRARRGGTSFLHYDAKDRAIAWLVSFLVALFAPQWQPSLPLFRIKRSTPRATRSTVLAFARNFFPLHTSKL